MEDRYDRDDLEKREEVSQESGESSFSEESKASSDLWESDMRTDSQSAAADGERSQNGSEDESSQSIIAGEGEAGGSKDNGIDRSSRSIIIGEDEGPQSGLYRQSSYQGDPLWSDSYQDSSYQEGARQNNSYQGNSYQGNTHQDNGYQGSGYERSGYQDSGYQGRSYERSSYQGNRYQGSGYQGSSYQSSSYVNGDHQSAGQSSGSTNRSYQSSYGNAQGDNNSYARPDREKTVSARSKERRARKGLKRACMVAGLAILFGVVASTVFFAANKIGGHFLADNEGASGTAGNNTEPVENISLTKSSSVVTSDVSDMVENVMPSVVSITNMTVEQVQGFFGGVYERQSESAGTGIIIAQTEEELLIVTNYHVIENSDTLTVAFFDESSATANLKGSDQDHDVAVIAVQLDDISAETRENIAIATMGDSTTLRVGEPAIAIGNALGYGQSVTTGVISALNREITTTDEYTGEVKKSSVKMIQTDAVINRGNSGGALLNANGEVIGINSAKLSGDTVEGIGYAIPISDVSDIIDNLMNQKTKTKVASDERGMLGIRGRDVPSESAEWFNMPLGVYIDSVEEGSGAEEAGLTKGNIITALNGVSIESMEDLTMELEYYAAGETVSLTIGVPENNGEYSVKTVEVTLMKQK